MNAQPNMITTKITLTDDQRAELARSLGIDAQFVPNELGVVGVARNSASTLGIPKAATPNFSPALIMM